MQTNQQFRHLRLECSDLHLCPWFRPSRETLSLTYIDILPLPLFLSHILFLLTLRLSLTLSPGSLYFCLCLSVVTLAVPALAHLPNHKHLACCTTSRPGFVCCASHAGSVTDVTCPSADLCACMRTWAGAHRLTHGHTNVHKERRQERIHRRKEEKNPKARTESRKQSYRKKAKIHS